MNKLNNNWIDVQVTQIDCQMNVWVFKQRPTQKQVNIYIYTYI